MNVRNQFPILKRKIIYLDNAATTQKPKQVIDSIKNYFENNAANVNRGMYSLGEESTNLYEKARTTVAKYINAKDKEIIFTKNTTDSLNLLAYSLQQFNFQEKNEIVITEMEHHANIIPWQELAKRTNMKLVYIKIKQDLTLDYQDAENKITEKTAIVSITHKSNVTGIKNDIEKIIKLAKRNNALSIIDAAQTALNTEIDVKKIDCDFLAFSGHKLFGPEGIGVLYGKSELLEKMNPAYFGGGMILKVKETETIWNETPYKFEAGTPNISGAVGLMNAIDFIIKSKQKEILKHDLELTKYALKELNKIPEIEIYGKNQEGILSFNVKNMHPHDISCLLNDKNICIRVGAHCAMPLLEKMKVNSTCRISFTIYNTKQEIGVLIRQLKNIIKILKK